MKYVPIKKLAKIGQNEEKLIFRFSSPIFFAEKRKIKKKPKMKIFRFGGTVKCKSQIDRGR